MDVSVEAQMDGTLAVKLSDDTCEVNVYAPRDELLRLRHVGSAEWDQRRTLCIGKSAGSPVFWAANVGGAVILIGSDDESWDVSVAIPQTAIDELVRQARLS